MFRHFFSSPLAMILVQSGRPLCDSPIWQHPKAVRVYAKLSTNWFCAYAVVSLYTRGTQVVQGRNKRRHVRFKSCSFDNNTQWSTGPAAEVGKLSYFSPHREIISHIQPIPATWFFDIFLARSVWNLLGFSGIYLYLVIHFSLAD